MSADNKTDAAGPDLDPAGRAASGSWLASLLSNPRTRAIVLQAAMALGIALFAGWIAYNTNANTARINSALGFDFLGDRAGFVIAQTLIPYTPEDTYFRAFLVGLTNTLLVAVLGIILATILGFLLGFARLSSNWLLAKIAGVYVETIRNVPLLLQLLFWYQAVLAALPLPGVALQLGGGATLSNRGLIFPRPVAEAGFGLVLLAVLAGIAAAIGVAILSRRRRVATGRGLPAGWIGLAAIIGLPALAFLASGQPLVWEQPVFGRFNFTGGVQIIPELFALLLGLVIYTAAFIAEVVRAGIQAVAKGQNEAAAALGLRRGVALRLVIVPQALRVIIPPLTNQYLNLTKNSSLAVAIAYPDLVGVFKNTVLNLSGHAVEVVFITMMVYLALSLLTALAMNIFNARLARTERR